MDGVAVTVDEIVVADPPESWARLGFHVEGDACDVGGVRIRLAGPDAGKRLVSWSLRGIDTTELDGLATTISSAPLREPAPAHPNGVTGIDHVVAFCPDLDRTVARLREAGFDLRRIREEPTPAGAPRQAFFRLGELILECVQVPDSPELDRSRRSKLWGLALVAPDLGATAAALGDRLGEPRDAVQPGRRIATLRREAGSSVPVAYMTPRPARAAAAR
jgi:catechol 2,3-dioxygenase-like lactoylglutathione lyase family enzyme